MKLGGKENEMTKPSKVAIIIPCHNEQDSIIKLIEDVGWNYSDL